LSQRLDISSISYKEILEQPISWKKTIKNADLYMQIGLDFFNEAKNKKTILFSGCGSSLYLGEVAAAYYRRNFNSWALSVASSEFLANPDVLFHTPEETAFVAISRSGETSETVMALKKAMDYGVECLAVTCTPKSTLATLGCPVLITESGLEESVVMTKSFSNMLLALCLGMNKARESDYVNLPEYADVIIKKYINQIFDFVNKTDIKRFIFLGTSERHGIAREASLKVKEMAICDSEPFETLEYRHGPISLVDDKTLVSCIISPHFRQYELKVLEDVRKYGGKTLIIDETEHDSDISVVLPEKCTDMEKVLLSLPVFHLLAFFKAHSKGINPDKPRHLSQFVTLSQ